jgi:hypothetical protein
MSERKAFWAKCPACDHVWPIAYLPMPMELCAKMTRRPACPQCGHATKIGIARQDDGMLLDDADRYLAALSARRLLTFTGAATPIITDGKAGEAGP